MRENYSLNEFLHIIAECSGDEAIEIISRFQSGSMQIEGIGIEDLEGID